MGKFIDLTGQCYGRLTPISRVGVSFPVKWNCLCSCGNYKVVNAGDLRQQKTKSCGCLQRESPPTKIDLIGRKFERLTVMEHSDSKYKSGKVSDSYWLCKCDCGNDVLVRGSSLRNGNTKSCGCYKIDIIRSLNYVDGKSNTKERIVHYTNIRRARKLQRTPMWSDVNKLKEIYSKCPSDKVVDHIIPLCGKLVSGLHVPSNLQYMSHSENSKKHNKFEVIGL